MHGIQPESLSHVARKTRGGNSTACGSETVAPEVYRFESFRSPCLPVRSCCALDSAAQLSPAIWRPRPDHAARSMQRRHKKEQRVLLHFIELAFQFAPHPKNIPLPRSMRDGLPAGIIHDAGGYVRSRLWAALFPSSRLLPFRRHSLALLRRPCSPVCANARRTGVRAPHLVALAPPLFSPAAASLASSQSRAERARSLSVARPLPRSPAPCARSLPVARTLRPQPCADYLSAEYRGRCRPPGGENLFNIG